MKKVADEVEKVSSLYSSLSNGYKQGALGKETDGF